MQVSRRLILRSGSRCLRRRCCKDAVPWSFIFCLPHFLPFFHCFAMDISPLFVKSCIAAPENKRVCAKLESNNKSLLLWEIFYSVIIAQFYFFCYSFHLPQSVFGVHSISYPTSHPLSYSRIVKESNANDIFSFFLSALLGYNLQNRIDRLSLKK